MSNYRLGDRAVLMRFTCGLPSQSRKDPRTTEEIKVARSLGKDSGRWIQDKYPKSALEMIKKKIAEARQYHNKLTFAFGGSDEDEDGSDAIKGIGILNGILIPEYQESMRRFASELSYLVETTFLVDPVQWVNWARAEHNGTFDPDNYPGASLDANGDLIFDEDRFKAEMRKRFYLKSEPLPVPDAEQFTESVSALLGTDVQSVNIRVRDATEEANRQLMARLIKPVQAMAAKLVEDPKGDAKDIRFKSSLVENIREIVDIAPKLNIGQDPMIDQFIAEMSKLTIHTPDELKQDKGIRSKVAAEAEATLKRLQGYKL